MEIHKTLNVGLKGLSYPITIGSDLSELVQESISHLIQSQRKIAVITDENLVTSHQGWMKSVFQSCEILVLPAGETTKSIDQLAKIYDFLCEKGIDRSSALFAFGGGVIGDITGFAAASYMRGISFYQIPTTLLAMVDSSVGGKTGINIKGGKNLVGAFYQPCAVYIDTELLNTLPPREFSAGMAEVIKTGLLGNADLYTKLTQDKKGLNAKHEDLSHVIACCCQLKAKVVEDDEKELATTGGRALLNLGHTFGHAIEAVYGYGHYLHGEAVAIGLIAAYLLSKELNYPVQELEQSLVQILKVYNLPTMLEGDKTTDELINAMYKDKKTIKGQLKFIVIKSVGQAITKEGIQEDLIRKVWKTMGAI